MLLSADYMPDTVNYSIVSPVIEGSIGCFRSIDRMPVCVGDFKEGFLKEVTQAEWILKDEEFKRVILEL